MESTPHNRPGAAASAIVVSQRHISHSPCLVTQAFAGQLPAVAKATKAIPKTRLFWRIGPPLFPVIGQQC